MESNQTFDNILPQRNPEQHCIGMNVHQLPKLIEGQNSLVRELIAEQAAFFEEIEIIKNELAEINSMRVTTTVPDSIGEPDTKILRETLYGSSPHWDFEITSTNPLPNPMCKGKLVDFEIELVSLTTAALNERETIPIEVKIYSASNPPQQLHTNLLGQTLLKGRITTNMSFERKISRHSGYTKFSINEVTSNLENGWVFLVIMAPQAMNIKPFVSERLVILAKERTCKKWREIRKVA